MLLVKEKSMNKVAYILVLVGALNWGLVGISSNLDLVQLLIGSWSEIVARVVYLLVGLSAVWLIIKKGNCKKSAPMSSQNPPMDPQM